jgi:glycosyltransferase involved in cell wall biosynthesis
VIGAEEDALSEVAGGLPSGCEIVGKVPYERVGALLANARVGLDVHPWLSPHLLPALAVKVCEYMACGCAVVASAMPVLDRLLAGSGLEPASLIRIVGGQPSDYARATVRLLESIDAGADPGSALRVFARQNLTFDGEAAKIARLYRALVDETPCAG